MTFTATSRIEDPTIRKAIYTTRRVRRHLRATGKWDLRLGGACIHAALLTCSLLNRFSCFKGGRFFHRSRARGFCFSDPCPGHDHFWIEVHGFVVDGTVTQFGSYPAVGVISTQAPLYRKYASTEIELRLIDLLDGYIDKGDWATPVLDPEITLPRMRAKHAELIRPKHK